ncbi:hypothetical protein [Lacisediminihabitans changchengi]|uniref:Alkaline shock response membrane anchor protein AmaP n=1 Tax=Lacisediminihabitans changchengi TaxID=2787634 RepID=A0A934SMD9_9MICO|nr:hypothetical protein [Lacisediminihabitans changchengi]MBK4348208.1 hypothetical protein [Lacisediminihabitans changchengi]
MTSLYPRILRRETHRSRSVAVSVALALFILVAAYVGLECGLAAFGAGPLLVSPAAAIDWLGSKEIIVYVAAGVAAVLGIALLLLAILPGRRARHAVPNERMAVVVDDGVLAGALARDARRVADVAPDRVHADVSKRRARIVITPTSGVPVDAPAAQAIADGLLTTLAPRPSVRARVVVSTRGTVGA